jgi:hypothetical protein
MQVILTQTTPESSRFDRMGQLPGIAHLRHLRHVRGAIKSISQGIASPLLACYGSVPLHVTARTPTKPLARCICYVVTDPQGGTPLYPPRTTVREGDSPCLSSPRHAPPPSHSHSLNRTAMGYRKPGSRCSPFRAATVPSPSTGPNRPGWAIADGVSSRVDFAFDRAGKPG